MPMSDRPKYVILQELGAGGMGTIHKGALVGQAGFQRPIVIKKLKRAGDPEHVRLFAEEARRYAVLDHENIGRMFDFELVDGELSMILEYIDGWSLVEYGRRLHELRRAPDIDLAVFIVSRVCRALQYVFERAAIVHRDISPSNIMTTREGAVKLIDFGIATLSGSRETAITGKPAYMAPEMIVELRADNRSDLFSLGAVMFEMLTGERLFSGSSTAEVLEQVITRTLPLRQALNPDIPEPVLAILKRALQRNPALRFASAAEMGAACEHYLYDNRYGPTNLTLKQRLTELFPDAGDSRSDVLLEPTLFPAPAGDGGFSPHVTPVAPVRAPTAEPPAEGGRRLRKRTRPRSP
jgi:eukaryotic-like serine/threonine-protein kinase